MLRFCPALRDNDAVTHRIPVPFLPAKLRNDSDIAGFIKKAVEAPLLLHYCFIPQAPAGKADVLFTVLCQRLFAASLFIASESTSIKTPISSGVFSWEKLILTVESALSGVSPKAVSTALVLSFLAEQAEPAEI